MSFIKKAIAVICLVFVVFLQQVEAQENVESAAPTDGSEISFSDVAQINLSNAAIIAESAEEITLYFTLENQGQIPQSDIRYGVQLMQDAADGTQTIVDFLVVEEVVALSAGEDLAKTFTYSLAGVPAGKYSVWLTARTSGGVILGLGMAGELTVASATGVEIQSNSCVLTVGDSPETYNLYEGVDVAAYEDLTITCMVQNLSSDSRTVDPAFKTFRRSIYGPEVAVAYAAFAPLTLAAGTEEEVSFVIPKAPLPQSYDVVLSFNDTVSQERVSNRLSTHYVLQGASATIQSVNFDKTSYAAGEEIIMDLYWTGSADGFFESRQGAGTDLGGDVTALVSVTDAAGAVCVSPIQTVLTEEMAEVKLVSTSECKQPVAKVSLVSSDGTVLDTREVFVPENTDEATEEVAPTMTKDNLSTLMLVTVLAFAGALLTLLLAIGRRKKVNVADSMKTMVVVLFATAAFMGVGVEKVEAVSWNHHWSNSEGWHNHNVTVNANKTTFNPGETITLSSVIYNADCANNSIPVHRLIATLQSTTITLSENPVSNTSGNKYGGGTFTAPTTPGTYVINLRMTTLNRNEHSYSSITITVAAPTPIPPAPTSISATCAVPNGAVAISWPAATGATYYAFRLDYPGDPVPHLVQLDSYTGTSYSSFVPQSGTNYATWVHACNGTGCSAAVSTNFSCVQQPTASITATGCTISEGNSSCSGSITNWSISYATTPNVYNETSGATLYSSASGSNQPVTLPYGTQTLAARDGGTNLATTNVSASCESGTVWSSGVCAVAPPTGSISAGGCTITAEGSSCLSTVSWTANNFVGSARVTQTTSGEEATSNPDTVSVSPDARTVKLDDLGSSFEITATANVTCANGGVWVPSLTKCAALPLIVLDMNPDVIRSGDTAEVGITITSTYDLTCTVTGGINETINHVGSGTAQSYTVTTNPLTSAQIVSVTCVADIAADLSNSSQGRVNVVPTVQEI